MKPTDTLVLAIIGHLVGDYLLQNDWMAQNKKKSSMSYAVCYVETCLEFFQWIAQVWSLPCFVHCSLWTLSVLWLSGWDSCHNRLLVFSILFVTHYVQDRTQIVKWWMTSGGHQTEFAKPPMAPWSIIVVDNVWHIVTLWAVWRFVV